MKPRCPHCLPLIQFEGPLSRVIVRSKGSYFRQDDAKRIPRFFCKLCKKSFSSSTGTPQFRQKKRRVNAPLFALLVSGVSQRRAAIILRINQKTVIRKFLYLSQQKMIEHQSFLQKLKDEHTVFSEIQIDEMETSEHSKWKPLSIALAVSENRKILGFQVSSMPPRGIHARLAMQKYGWRPDRRKKGFCTLLKSLQEFSHENLVIKSDEKPMYGPWIKKYFSNIKHQTFKGRRGCVVGQGELKRGGRDPLFILNHTAAMIRANINRLFRRTWCTTKKADRLLRHLYLYAAYHNQVLTPS